MQVRTVTCARSSPSTISVRQILLFCLLIPGLIFPIAAAPPGQSAECDDWWVWAGDHGPGFGVEIESAMIHFLNAAYKTLQDTKALLRQVVGGIRSTYWSLTAEGEGTAGSLRAEIIFDGRRLRVGYPDAEQAALEASQHMIHWDPVRNEGAEIHIEGSQAGPWTIHTDAEPFPSGQPRGTADIAWFIQITAALPLRCIYNLVLKAQERHPQGWLLPNDQEGQKSYLLPVYREYFQATGVPEANLNDDVLGFFSVLISYLKQIDRAPPGTGPKRICSIMPRTDWTTIYNTIRQFIPSGIVLWDLVNILVCYKSRRSGRVVIDTQWCDGTVDHPITSEKLDDELFEFSEEDTGMDLWVKWWIYSIDQGQVPDQLTLFDLARYTGSIGGLGSRMEYVLYTAVLAPIWEFRDLINFNTLAFQQVVRAMMEEVVNYHRGYKEALGLPTPHTWDVPAQHRVRRKLKG